MKCYGIYNNVLKDWNGQIFRSLKKAKDYIEDNKDLVIVAYEIEEELAY